MCWKNHKLTLIGCVLLGNVSLTYAQKTNQTTKAVVSVPASVQEAAWHIVSTEGRTVVAFLPKTEGENETPARNQSFTATSARTKIQKSLNTQSPKIIKEASSALCFAAMTPPVIPRPPQKESNTLLGLGPDKITREVIKDLAKLMGTLSSDQLQQLKDNGFAMDINTLDAEQVSLINKLTYNTIANSIKPIYGTPGAKIGLKFEYDIQVFSPDGSTAFAQVADTGQVNKANPLTPVRYKPPALPTYAPLPQKTFPPNGDLPTNRASVALPKKKVPVYTLRELAELAQKSTGEEWHVDRRISEQSVLLVSKNRVLPADELARLMAASGHYVWRTVDGVRFLSLQNLEALAYKNLQELEEARQHRLKLFDFLRQNDSRFGPLSVVANQQAWGDLPPELQFDLSQMAQQATGPEGDQLRALLNDPNSMAGAQVRMTISVIIYGQVGEYDGGGAVHRLVN